MNPRVWRWISATNLFRWLSSDQAEELKQVHKFSDKKLAEEWMNALATPNEASMLTLEAAARFYAKVKRPSELPIIPKEE